jgi:AcrR family transcriptional regulator
MFERGAAGTSLEDVHAASEVSPSQIYHYFKDKRSLVKAVIAVQVTQVIGAFGSVSLSTAAWTAWRRCARGRTSL